MALKKFFVVYWVFLFVQGDFGANANFEDRPNIITPSVTDLHKIRESSQKLHSSNDQSRSNGAEDSFGYKIRQKHELNERPLSERSSTPAQLMAQASRPSQNQTASGWSPGGGGARRRPPYQQGSIQGPSHGQELRAYPREAQRQPARPSPSAAGAERGEEHTPDSPWIEESMTEEMTSDAARVSVPSVVPREPRPLPQRRAPPPTSSSSRPRPQPVSSSPHSPARAPPQPPANPPPTQDAASMQWMLTQRMRRTLIQELDYLPSEVDQMDPQVAAVVIRKGLKRPPSGMPVSWKRNRRADRNVQHRNSPRMQFEIPIKAIVLSPLRASKFAFLLPFRVINTVLKPLNKCSETIGYVATVAASTSVVILFGLLWSGTVEVSQDSISNALDVMMKSMAAIPQKMTSLSGKIASFPSKIDPRDRSKKGKTKTKKDKTKSRRFKEPSRSSRTEPKIDDNIPTGQILPDIELGLKPSDSDTWLDSAIDSLFDKMK